MRQKNLFKSKSRTVIGAFESVFVGAFFFSTDVDAVESTKGLESMVSSLLSMSLAVVCEKSDFKQSL